jgi:hypothetical protein
MSNGSAHIANAGTTKNLNPNEPTSEIGGGTSKRESITYNDMSEIEEPKLENHMLREALRCDYELLELASIVSGIAAGKEHDAKAAKARGLHGEQLKSAERYADKLREASYVLKKLSALTSTPQPSLYVRKEVARELYDCLARMKSLVASIPQLNLRKYTDFGIEVNNALTAYEQETKLPQP